jgi:hypothetical protein
MGAGSTGAVLVLSEIRGEVIENGKRLLAASY